MDDYTLDMTARHRFLDAARAYLGMTRTVTASPQLRERRDPARLLAGQVSALPEFRKTRYRENVPG